MNVVLPILTGRHKKSATENKRSVIQMLPGGTLVLKNPPANAGDGRGGGSSHWLRRYPGGGKGNPLQYACLEHPMDRGACPQGRKESDRTEVT